MEKKLTQKKKCRLRGVAMLLCLFIAAALSAQTTQKVEYTYDEAGNRISRKVIVLTNNQYSTNPDFTHPAENDLGERKIIVYPNPTKGVLGVEIKGGSPKDEVKIMTFSMQGVLINTEKGSGASLTRVDLSPFPAGQYIMRVIVGGKNTEYKIIKE